MHFFSAPCVVWRHQLDMARCTTSRSWVHEHLWFCNCKHPSTKSLQVARHCPVMRRPRRPPTWALTLDQVWSKVSATSWLGSIVHSAARDSSNKPHATTPKDHRSAALEISTWQKRARLNNGWLIENKRAQTLSKIPGFHFHPTIYIYIGLSVLCMQAFNTSVLQGVQLVPMGDHTVVDQSFCKSKVGQSHATSFEA